MAYLKFLASFWTGVLVYCLLSVTLGGAGISAYRQLFQERERQADNIRELKTTRQTLSGERDALDRDPETILLRARDLGYGRAEDHFIRIVGADRPMQPRRSAGQAVTIHAPEFLSDAAIRVAAIIAGGLTLLFLAICENLRKLL